MLVRTMSTQRSTSNFGLGNMAGSGLFPYTWKGGPFLFLACFPVFLSSFASFHTRLFYSTDTRNRTVCVLFFIIFSLDLEQILSWSLFRSAMACPKFFFGPSLWGHDEWNRGGGMDGRENVSGLDALTYGIRSPAPARYQ